MCGLMRPRPLRNFTGFSEKFEKMAKILKPLLVRKTRCSSERGL